MHCDTMSRTREHLKNILMLDDRIRIRGIKPASCCIPEYRGRTLGVAVFTITLYPKLKVTITWGCSTCCVECRMQFGVGATHMEKQ
jgi:hypothetical protein